MSRVKNTGLFDFLHKKKESFKVRVTGYLQGSVKNRFLEDCIKRDVNESKLIAEIISSYYEILDQEPEIKQKEIDEITNYLKNKIKNMNYA